MPAPSSTQRGEKCLAIGSQAIRPKHSKYQKKIQTNQVKLLTQTVQQLSQQLKNLQLQAQNATFKPNTSGGLTTTYHFSWKGLAVQTIHNSTGCTTTQSFCTNGTIK